MLAGVALGEWWGWPFLAAPLQRMLGDSMQRRVVLAPQGFQIRFVGGLRLQTPLLEVAAPEWSKTPHMLLAQDLALELRYLDLWRAYQGQPLRIQSLQARTLDSDLERLADGRASWQFGPAQPATKPSNRLAQLPLFGHLQVDQGAVRVNDAPLGLALKAQLSLAPSRAAQAEGPVASVLQLQGNGRYRNLPLKLEVQSSGVLPSELGAAPTLPVSLALDLSVGRAKIHFKGRAADVLQPRDFQGNFNVQGPSLAAVGDPLGVTLPTTSAFRTTGAIARKGTTWSVVVGDATVGTSSLNGAFTYETARPVPLLAGRLGGKRLQLADLGPVVGTTPATMAASEDASVTVPATRGKGRVLPNRPFDLAAMRVMDANVLIDIQQVDLNSRLLEPLQPLSGHLQLQAGLLTLQNMVARTAQGQVMGAFSLDGRADEALWKTDLRWSGVQLDHWLRQTRDEGQPPYVSGQLQGQAQLQGKGRSTAEILASLQGQLRMDLRNGAVSHLGVELLGLDLARSLGVWIKGDDALPVSCAVADLTAAGGVFRPKVMVVDTDNSTVWTEGSLSLASETMDLRLVVSPKDFSPLALRTPIRVSGSFSKPDVSLEKGPLGLKAASAVLLGLINPFAALIPLMDLGDSEKAQQGAAGCQGLRQRTTALVKKPAK
ncbi:MAG: AsmA family protein [Burkholderiales bacterium]|nr:AsmA family protein [Burkholderiales bacterium]